MNRRMIAYILGLLLLCEAGLLLLPTAVALIYGETVLTAFLLSIAILITAGLILISCKPTDKTIYSRDGLLIVSLGWILMSLFGALPFFLSGEIPNYLDAVFEAVAGFTTTGASIISDVEALPKSLLFWRSFSNWIGGMGVLVFVMAVLPLAGGGGNIHLMRAESPGPSVGKLVPRSNKTARILYGIYFGMTAIEVVLLLLGDMSLFESLTLSFGTAGTGGFSITNSSIADYTPYCQTVITVFMALFGVNFNIYFLILCKKFKDAFKSTELWVYFGIMAGVTAVVTLNIRNYYDTFLEAFRHSAFQISAFMTSTGYSTADYNQWPELSKMLILFVMFIGACAGSTGGGFKISRIILLFKYAQKELRRLSHPRSVNIITFDGRRISEETIHGTLAYLIVYIMIFCISVIAVSVDDADITTSVSGVIATLNNIGLGLGELGPTGNYGNFSALTKIVFIFDMLIGRLEIFPIIYLLTPSSRRKHFTSKKL